GEAMPRTLDFSVTDPSGYVTKLGTFQAAPLPRDEFGVRLKEGLTSPPLVTEGMHRFTFAVRGLPHAVHVRDIWVVEAKQQPVPGRVLRIGLSGVWPVLRVELAAVPGIAVEDYAVGERYDAIISSGLNDRSTPAQRLGGDAGLTLQRSTGSAPEPG